MMVRPSSSNHKTDKLKQPPPHLSGSYIRSLVKHLTSIKPKQPSFNAKDPFHHNNMQQSPPPPSPPPPPHKKQVRRRHHIIKPFKQRQLLNMAEARREIVTALKFHRASMKPQQQTANIVNHPQLPQSYPSSTTTTTTLLPPLYHENLNFTLPKQTLGLNLNFQDFYQKPISNHSISSSSSLSSLSCSSSSSSVMSDVAVVNSTTSGGNGGLEVGGSKLHHAVDEDEMEKIRSLGEQHQMEWNDAMNMLMSARWFKFLKTLEIEPQDGKFDLGFDLFDQVIMEFPLW